MTGKYPQSCSSCGSRDVTKLDKVGLRCNKCGYRTLRKVPAGAPDFRTYEAV
jgi:DNA-directed RNA polymerase subunit RPC12/RpoP